MSVRVVSHKLEADSAANGQVAYFQVETRASHDPTRAPVACWRRYRQFDRLRAELGATAACALPALPPKTWGRRVDAEFLERRRQGLDAFARELFPLLDLPLVRAFVGLREAVDVAGESTGESKGEEAEEQPPPKPPKPEHLSRPSSGSDAPMPLPPQIKPRRSSKLKRRSLGAKQRSFVLSAAWDSDANWNAAMQTISRRSGQAHDWAEEGEGEGEAGEDEEQEEEALAGWLLKRGGMLRQFQRRYFTLRHGRLTHYAGDDALAEPLGATFLARAAVAVHADQRLLHVGELVLQAADAADLQRWAHAAQHSVDAHSPQSFDRLAALPDWRPCRACATPACARCFSREGSEGGVVCAPCFFQADQLRRYREAVELIAGFAPVTKHSKKGRPHARRVFLGDDAASVQWADPSGRASRRRARCIPLEDVDAVVDGAGEPVFRLKRLRTRRNVGELDRRCLSVVGSARSLDLEFESQADRDAWGAAMRTVLFASRSRLPGTGEAGVSQDEEVRDELTEDERALLDAVAVDAELAAAGEAAGMPLDEPTRLRYLRATHWDAAQATARLRATVEWRAAFGVPALDASRDPLALAGKMYTRGRDRAGRPLIYFRPRREPDGFDGPANLRLLVHTLEQALAGEGAADQVCFIVDCRGFKRGMAPGSDARRELGAVLGDHYPRRLGRMFILDPPSAAMFLWKVVSRFLPPSTKARITFVSMSTAEKRAFFEPLVALESLEEDFGGDLGGWEGPGSA